MHDTCELSLSPWDQGVERLTQGGGVYNSQKAQVDAHEEVSTSQIADEEARHVHLGATDNADKENASVSQESEEEDDPDSAS